MDRKILSGIINGTNVMLAMLVSELEKSGAVTKAQFAEQLRTAVRGALEASGDASRADYLMMSNLADLLEEPREKWTPVVIEGGKASDD